MTAGDNRAEGLNTSGRAGMRSGDAATVIVNQCKLPLLCCGAGMLLTAGVWRDEEDDRREQLGVVDNETLITAGESRSGAADMDAR
jgi:hypothetical protein